MRMTIREVLTATFALATLVVILEHAGGFSKILSSGASAYSTGFKALTGKK